MSTQITIDDSGNRTGMLTVELVLGKVLQITLGPRLSNVLFETGVGERVQVTLHTDIFKEYLVEKLYGVRVICAVKNRELWIPGPDSRSSHLEHEIHSCFEF